MHERTGNRNSPKTASETSSSTSCPQLLEPGVQLQLRGRKSTPRWRDRNSLLIMRMLVALHVLSAGGAVQAAEIPAAAPRPHLLMVLGDDLGFYDTQIYNPTSPTPHLKSLAEQGVRLDRHYVFRYCSPTRRSMLSGRIPNHITSVQPDGANLCSDFLPLAATLLSEKLSARSAERVSFPSAAHQAQSLYNETCSVSFRPPAHHPHSHVRWSRRGRLQVPLCRKGSPGLRDYGSPPSQPGVPFACWVPGRSLSASLSLPLSLSLSLSL